VKPCYPDVGATVTELRLGYRKNLLWGLEYLAILLLSKLESEKSKPSLKILNVEILENNT
jgi:hypothetical protein